MANARLNRFEQIARQAYRFTQVEARYLGIQHPFEQRDIHDSLPQIVRTLFDNGHYSQATFEAFKYLDKLIQKITTSTESGFKLRFEDENYLVVLARRRGYLILWTAYLVTELHRKKKLNKEYEGYRKADAAC